VSSASEWSSLASVFQEFRVLKICLRLCPRPTVTYGTPPPLALCKFYGNTAPSNLGGVFAFDNVHLLDPLVTKEFRYSIDARNFPNAIIWSNTATGVAVANDYGIAYIQADAQNISTGVLVYSGLLEYIAEFRGCS
jgi:hypothetical protein